MHHAVNPDPYRGAFGSDAEKYVRDVQEIIEFGTTGHVAGFISEAIQVRERHNDAAAALAALVSKLTGTGRHAVTIKQIKANKVIYL